MKAWDITIDSDESGFTMRVRTEDCPEGMSACEFTFNIQAVAEDLLKAVKREIGPWVYEMEQAKATFASRVTVEQVQEELDAGVYDHDAGKREWARRVVDGEVQP